MLELDGSLGEGGGQVLRSCLALSLLTGQPFRLANIRARRSRPGLQPQHLTCVRAAAEIGSATIRGASVGSSVIDFEPSTVRAGEYHFAIGTAGSTGLVLQTVYLPLALAPQHSQVILEGGTHNEHAPCFHFLSTTWRAYMARIGLEIAMSMERPGFYPRGGGRVIAHIAGKATPRGMALNHRDNLTRVTGFSAVASLPEHVAQRQARRAISRLKDAGYSVAISLEEWQGGPGSVIALVFDEAPVPTLFSGLGARGKRAEAVAEDAVKPAIAYAHTDAPVDPYSADQLVLPLAFAPEPSEYRVSRITQHLLTNIDVVRQFVDREITCDGSEGDIGSVRIGPRNPS
ncbi:MAG: RNA 3'-terminal phosphate cyclase [Gemmataceae bacterium]